MISCQCEDAVVRMERRDLIGEALFCQNCGGYVADNLDEFS